MSEESKESAKSYKGLMIALLVVLIIILIGCFVYRRNLLATQAHQQQQIEALNKEVTDAKTNASQQAAEVQNQRINALEKKNADLQKQVDDAAAKKPTDPATTPSGAQ